MERWGLRNSKIAGLLVGIRVRRLQNKAVIARLEKEAYENSGSILSGIVVFNISIDILDMIYGTYKNNISS